MDRHGPVPFLFDINFAGPAAIPCQNYTTEPQMYYHGMDVHVLNSPGRGYLNQSDADQINAPPVIPLNEFSVASLSQAFPDSVDESDLNVILQSIIDEDAPMTLPDSYSDNQSCSSGNEREIREKVPADRLNPDHHLTPLPAEPAKPQDPQSVAVINPLNRPQPASDNPANSTEIVDDKSSLLEQKIARRREYHREYQRMLRKNPDYVEREKMRRKTPHNIEREKQRQKERRKNPDYAEREKKRQKTPGYMEYQIEYKNRPAALARRKMLRKERLKDPVRRERLRELQRKREAERYHNDPTYAEGRRIYSRTYNRMKKKFGREEATKLALVAKKTYLQSVNTPEAPGNLPQKANINSDLLPSQTE